MSTACFRPLPLPIINGMRQERRTDRARDRSARFNHLKSVPGGANGAYQAWLGAGCTAADHTHDDTVDRASV